MSKLLLVLAVCSILPGCVAWEIRDAVRATNQNLYEVTPVLIQTQRSVEQTNQEIAQTQTQLAEVQAALAKTQAQLDSLYASLGTTDEHVVTVGGSLGQTNLKLNDVDDGLTRMRILEDVHSSLNEANAALKPLSIAMGSLGGAMSFLGLNESSSDLLAEDENASEGAAAPTTASAGAHANAPTAGAEPDAADPNAPKRPDPILGTWVMVYPPSSQTTGAPPTNKSSNLPSALSPAARVLVLHANGMFLIATEGSSLVTGRWSRSGRSLTFTSDSTTTTPAAETVELLTLNSRTLTVRRGDTIRVYARP